MCSPKNARNPKGSYWATVVSNQLIKECYYRLFLELEPSASTLFGSVIPGQFAMFDLTETSLPVNENIPDPLRDTVKRHLILRRPFSFSDVCVVQRPEGQVVQLSVMYCVLGPSTVRMTTLSRGDKISVLGPLGNGFQVRENKEVAILIAGGMGSPPILHLASVLKSRFAGMKVMVFAGAKNYDSMPFTIEINNKTGPVVEEFQQINVNYCLSTDDGSMGFKGYVTNAVENWLIKNPLEANKTIIYACGPEAMLAATAKLSVKYDIDCQVSMERMMACGIGVCQSCAIEQKTAIEGQTEYRLCCQDGPVFDAKNVFFGSEG
jgi:dihydroorotate dehydrogenase electron transfer subunit